MVKFYSFHSSGEGDRYLIVSHKSVVQCSGFIVDDCVFWLVDSTKMAAENPVASTSTFV